MAKLVLGNKPKSFNKTITIELFNGKTADIEMQYKYRTKSEYTKFLDELNESTKSKAKQKKSKVTEPNLEGDEKIEKPQKTSEIYAEIDSQACDFILEIAEGWDLTNEFSKASLLELIDEFPSAPTVIIEAYRSACLEGRLKN